MLAFCLQLRLGNLTDFPRIEKVSIKEYWGKNSNLYDFLILHQSSGLAKQYKQINFRNIQAFKKKTYSHDASVHGRH